MKIPIINKEITELQLPKILNRQIPGGVQKSTFTGAGVAATRLWFIIKDQTPETILPFIKSGLAILPTLTIGEIVPELSFWGLAIYSVLHDETKQPRKISQLKKWADRNGYKK